MKYLIIGRMNLCFCDTVQHLGQALYYRNEAECRVVVSDDWDSLLGASRIGYQRLLDCSTDKSIPHIALPSVVTEPLFLEYASAGTLMPVKYTNVGEIGVWGISALNGYCIAKSIEEFCQIIDGNEMVYPIAQWFSDIQEAVMASRNNYVRRFYTRYNPQIEQTNMPQQYLEYFNDPFFSEREKRREMQRESLQRIVLDNWERGW